MLSLFSCVSQREGGRSSASFPASGHGAVRAGLEHHSGADAVRGGGFLSAQLQQEEELICHNLQFRNLVYLE